MDRPKECEVHNPPRLKKEKVGRATVAKDNGAAETELTLGMFLILFFVAA